jgi:hypothetical protein
MLGCGCATMGTPPRGWLQNPQERSDGFGGWMAIALRPEVSGLDLLIEGELIAVGEDSLYLLTGNALQAISWDDVRKAELRAYDSNAGALLSWAFVGLLTTPSHGVWLLISAPTWLITGIVTTAVESRAGRFSHSFSYSRPSSRAHRDDRHLERRASHGRRREQAPKPSQRVDARPVVQPRPGQVFAAYARFPQGLPPGLDRSSLTRK